MWLVALVVWSTALPLLAAQRDPEVSRTGSNPGVRQLFSLLDEALAEEQHLLQAIEEIKQELAIVKVRAARPNTVYKEVNFLPSGQPCPVCVPCP
jgi:hypothetical protein